MRWKSFQIKIIPVFATAPPSIMAEITVMKDVQQVTLLGDNYYACYHINWRSSYSDSRHRNAYYFFTYHYHILFLKLFSIIYFCSFSCYQYKFRSRAPLFIDFFGSQKLIEKNCLYLRSLNWWEESLLQLFEWKHDSILKTSHALWEY